MCLKEKHLTLKVANNKTLKVYFLWSWADWGKREGLIIRKEIDVGHSICVQGETLEELWKWYSDARGEGESSFSNIGEH